MLPSAISLLRRVSAATTCSFLAIAVVTAAGPAASAAPAFAPADQATIHPGVMVRSSSGQCTANFIFTAGSTVYIGQAAHCTTTSGSTTTNGCDAGSLPLGTEIQIDGADKPGVLAYNSWLTMHAVGEKDQNICAFNDLALVRIDPADVDKVNPSIPFWGGPTGTDTNGTALGDTVLSYGNSELRNGIAQLSPKQGKSLGDAGAGWSHNVFTATPGIPGDSGSAFLDANGRALGVLSTLQIAPLVGSNGVGDLSRELSYLNSHANLGGVQLAPGTEPFRGPLLPL
jgi:hypothetical protein